MATKQSKPAVKQVSAKVKKPAPAKSPALQKAKANLKAAKASDKVTLKDGTIKLNKKESQAFHATKSMDEKAMIVATAALKGTAIPAAVKKAIAQDVVKGAKDSADKAVAKRQDAIANKIVAGSKAKAQKAAGKAFKTSVAEDLKTARKISQVAKKAANIVEKKDGPKAAAPLKRTIKKLDNVIAATEKTSSATKGYKETTQEANSAAVARRNFVGDAKPLTAPTQLTREDAVARQEALRGTFASLANTIRK